MPSITVTSTMHKTLDQYQLSCKEQRLKLTKDSIDGYNAKGETRMPCR